jgi:hypothetical protein
VEVHPVEVHPVEVHPVEAHESIGSNPSDGFQEILRKKFIILGILRKKFINNLCL